MSILQRANTRLAGGSLALVASLFAALVAQPVAFGAQTTTASATSQPVAIGTGGAVTSVDVDATHAGIAILKQGGNAVDAAVATAAALGVTEPYVAGVGGGGFMVVYLKGQNKVITIDGREKAPTAMTEDAFIDPSTGEPIPFYPDRVTTGLAVGVPGTLLQWKQALDRYGTMSLSQVLQPAIDLAQKGFVVDQTYHDQTQQNIDRFKLFTSTRSYYLTPDGQAPTIGSVVTNPDLAATYKLIASKGLGVFYKGAIGKAIVDTVTHPPLAPDAQPSFTVYPGVMAASDLRNYTAPERTPTHVGYRGYDVFGMAPPSSGGSTVGEALNILEGYRLKNEDRPLALHQYIEASRLAFADRNRYVGDPDFVKVPLDGLLSQGFADERRCKIGATAAVSPVPPGDPYPPYDTTCSASGAGATAKEYETSTNHLTTSDAAGNIVSYTNTIEQLGGSAIAVPGYGFLLNNELTDFDPKPLSPDQPDPNLPAGGKRPRSSMSPTVVLKSGKPVLAVGSPGGSTIITTVLQILVNDFDFGMSLPDAVAAPRASQRNTSTTLAEPAFISTYGSVLSSQYGQQFTSTPEIGAATGIAILGDGRVEAVAEPVRRGGGDAEVVNPIP